MMHKTKSPRNNQEHWELDTKRLYFLFTWGNKVWSAEKEHGWLLCSYLRGERRAGSSHCAGLVHLFRDDGLVSRLTRCLSLTHRVTSGCFLGLMSSHSACLLHTNIPLLLGIWEYGSCHNIVRCGWDTILGFVGILWTCADYELCFVQPTVCKKKTWHSWLKGCL